MRVELCIALYFLCVNLLGIIANCDDKHRAKRQKRRIPERTLWHIAFFGGAPASYITMEIIRHKTKHKRFMIGMPILSVIDLAAFGYLLYIFMR